MFVCVLDRESGGGRNREREREKEREREREREKLKVLCHGKKSYFNRNVKNV